MQVCCLSQYTSNQETRCHWYPPGLLSLLFSLNTDQLFQRVMVEIKPLYLGTAERYLLHLLKVHGLLGKLKKIEPGQNFQEQLPKVHCRTRPPGALLPPSVLGNFQPKWKAPAELLMAEPSASAVFHSDKTCVSHHGSFSRNSVLKPRLIQIYLSGVQSLPRILPKWQFQPPSFHSVRRHSNG